MVIMAPLTADRHEETARFFHAVWHETHAHLQPPKVAEHRDLAFFRNRVAQRALRTTLALIEGRVAGFACWTGSTLNSLFVAKSFRNGGIGQALLAEMERQMTTAGATALALNCLEGNDAARRFYERNGWRLSHREVKQNQVAEGAMPVATWIMIKP